MANCPLVMINQFNMVRGMIPKNTFFTSFYVPFYADPYEKMVLFENGKHFKDGKVSALNIAVETNKGAVRLSGVAKSNHEAQSAERIARSIPGVRSVRNDIAVR